MGVSLERVVRLFAAGYVQGERPQVLDIGCSNLHSIDPEALKAFVRARNDVYEPEALDQWARFMAAGGIMDSEIGGINGAWLGDLLERAGMSYTAFDIFHGYNTEAFDLNGMDLPESRRCRYDLVLNLGTTEHLLGQYNAFKVIHEATAVGGVVYHDLPMTGHLDHGFYNYNPVLLVSLAEANGYEILELSFSGAVGGESVAREFGERYGQRPYFKTLPGADESWKGAALPTASLTLIARKLTDAPFRASLETSTTVGAVVDDIGRHYGAEGLTPAALQARAMEQVQGVLARLADPALTLDEMNAAYSAFVGAGLTRGFPLTLELRILDETLKQVDDPSIVERRETVQGLLRRERPLLKAVDAALDAGEPPGALRLDGIETAFDLSGDEPQRLRRIIAAYRAYADGAAVERFPVRLEAIALERLLRQGPRDIDLMIRLGAVMAEVTPTLTVARREGGVGRER